MPYAQAAASNAARCQEIGVRKVLGLTPFVVSLGLTLAIAASVVLLQAVRSARVAPAALARYE